MTTPYPTSFPGIRDWADANGVGLNEARTRFALYVVLFAVARSRVLSGMLVFKGGNALDFVWRPNRSTQDLDFSVDTAVIEPGLDSVALRERLHDRPIRALDDAGRTFGVALRLHFIKQ